MQSAVRKQIVKKNRANYVIGLKANQAIMQKEMQEYAIRAHWGIENSLHWVLNVVFREDQWATMAANAAANLATIESAAPIV